jgi:hypothetical protein
LGDVVVVGAGSNANLKLPKKKRRFFSMFER